MIKYNVICDGLLGVEANSGQYVKVEVAQELYDALKRLEESARMVMAGEMEKSSIMVERMAAQKALSLADGESE